MYCTLCDKYSRDRGVGLVANGCKEVGERAADRLFG